MSKNLFLLLFSVVCMSTMLSAQQAPKSTKIEEAQVPTSVKSSYEEILGYEVLYWEKVSINANQERYVATYTSLDPASGQMLTRRVRYNPKGFQTSMSTYFLAKGQKADSQTLQIHLGTGGVEGEVLQRFEKVMRDANVVSFERAAFQPGNRGQEQEEQNVFRVISKSKNRITVAYYTEEFKLFDMKAYPLRALELSDMDVTF